MKSSLLMLGLVAFIGLTACSKEKRVENRLTKKGGEWNIDLETYTYYSNGVADDTESYANAGSFVFSENGTLIYNYSYNGETDSQGGTWTNTEDEIRMIFDGEVVAMKITDDSKKSMTLEWTEVYADEKEVYTYELTRKD